MQRAQVWSTVHETTRVIYNEFATIFNVVVSGWNTVAVRVFQPVVFGLLDIVSIVFAGSEYKGVINEATVPYQGHICGRDVESARFCGSTTIWGENLGLMKASGTAMIGNGSQLLVLSPGMTRRLSEVTGESLVGEVPLDNLEAPLADLTGSFSLIAGTTADTASYVIWSILRESGTLLWNAAQLVVSGLGSAALMVAESGALSTILSIGIDLIITLLLYVALPLATATLDVVLCTLHLIIPIGWDEELQCISEKCFQTDGQMAGDIFYVHTSIYPVGVAVSNAITSLLNPTTGRRYGTAGAGPSTSMPGIDAGAAMPSHARACASCYVCRVGELRTLWLLVRALARHAHPLVRAPSLPCPHPLDRWR